MHVRALVVVENRLVLWIRGRGVYLARHSLARQIAIFGVKLAADRGRDLFEILGIAQAEAAEKDSAVPVQFLLDQFTVVARPIG